MTTLASIVYDTRDKLYYVILEDSQGVCIVSQQGFNTQAEAEAFYAQTRELFGMDSGEPVPPKRS